MANEETSVEDVVFPPFLTPLGSTKQLLYGGAGVRGIQINPQVFLKVTVLGIYMEPQIIEHLSHSWKGKSQEQLLADEGFFKDITTAPFEKFVRVTMLQPLPGPKFTAKVMENSKAVLEEAGTFGESESKAIEDFEKLFEDRTLLPKTGPLYLISPAGIAVAFEEDGVIPNEPVTLISNRAFGEALLYTIIGKDGVSPDLKIAIAKNISTLLAK